MPNHNKDLTAKAALLWSTMNSTELIEQRESMARYLEKRRREGAFSDVSVARGGTGLIGEGRGIVFTAGNAVDYFTDHKVRTER
jgi:alpha 1,2-mannosyltransferase